ncbi:MAG: 4Fe-4S dicluster domain-containing protein [Acidimicrobiia bacterium]|nr:4Fe-4S dicluster domain-containing protein [Acidimicrobiia bacterium]
MRVSTALAAETRQVEGFDAAACLNCGVCTALCPLGYEILPRRLFRLVLLGLEERLAEHVPQIYSCLLCRMCEANCPAGVHIAENIRALRTIVGRRRLS